MNRNHRLRVPSNNYFVKNTKRDTARIIIAQFHSNRAISRKIQSGRELPATKTISSGYQRTGVFIKTTLSQIEGLKASFVNEKGWRTVTTSASVLETLATGC